MKPKVSLVAFTAQPAALAVASARTCYASQFVFAGKLTPKGERTRMDLLSALPEWESELTEIGHYDTAHERRIELVDQICATIEDEATRDAVSLFADLARQRAHVDTQITQSIYEAGHHTPFQHPTFVFGLEGVSRNVVESFFHQHTFYNSEQQSQRYVEMKRAEVIIPPTIAANPEAKAVFEDAVRASWAAYDELRDTLVTSNLKVMGAIAKLKGQGDDDARKEAEKKSQEMARYVIPIAASTKLYHTISGIVLLRYMRMANSTSAPAEAKQVVDAMAEAVRQVDPTFFARVGEEPHAVEDLPEARLTSKTPLAPGVELGDLTSVLTHHTGNATDLVVRTIREITGSDADDDELLATALDPAVDRIWNDTLNTWDHSPVLRALRHVHYTFHKRQSLTAYAQDQRHRLTPGTRPMLQRAVYGPPDVYVPDVVTGDALGAYQGAIQSLWDAMDKLGELGIPDDERAYLLPNATNIYYTQSGDLLSYIHKWRLRLCFNAQKEIFEASLDELRQVQEVDPALTRFLGPPCTFLAARQPQEKQDDIDACCPEGPRWCGIKVWKNFDAGKGTPKRPY